MNATEFAYATGLTTVDTLSNTYESGDASCFCYLVKITWEYTSQLYVIETPVDTDDASELRRLVQAVYPRDEAITAFELISQF